MTRTRSHKPFTDRQLTALENGRYDGLVKRLAAELRTTKQQTRAHILPAQISKLKDAYADLCGANDATLPVEKVVTTENFQQKTVRVKPDPNQCCPRHGTRWFNRLGMTCVCLKCNRIWEAE